MKIAAENERSYENAWKWPPPRRGAGGGRSAIRLGIDGGSASVGGNKIREMRLPILDDNFIDIFLPDKELRKQILGIQTDSTPLEDPKNTKDCNVFNLYKLIATEEQTFHLKEKYESGNFGFGHAKQELFKLICNKFSKEREKFSHLMENKDIIEKELEKGAEKARKIAKEVLMRVRKNIGY